MLGSHKEIVLQCLRLLSNRCHAAVGMQYSFITCPMGSAGLEAIYLEHLMHHLYNTDAMLYLKEFSQHIT